MLLRPPYSTLLNAPPRDRAASIFASYGTAGILLGDLDPARLTASGLSPSYLESTGVTAASTSGQTLGLLLERSGGAALGPELVVNGGFGADANWTKNTGWSIVGGKAVFNTAAGSSNLLQDLGMVAGKFYRVAEIVELSAGSVNATAGSPNGGLQPITAPGYYTNILRRGDNGILYYTAAATFIGTVDNVSARLVTGNHLYQSTSADEPTLVQENGIWRLRGDGLTKNFLTPLVPAASMTVLVACEFNAVLDAVIGGNTGTSSNGFNIVTDSSGRLGARVSSDSQTVIFGGSDIRGISGVAVLRFDGSIVKLDWKPFEGAISRLYTGAQNSAMQTTGPIRVGAWNYNGGVNLPLDGDIFRVLAQQSAYTDAEISTIASQWSRELGGTG